MTKFTVLFVAALAFQATFAIPQYFEEGKLMNYMDEIQVEVKDLTLFLRNDFPVNQFSVKTITWQCRQLAVVVDDIINKLHEEIFLRHEEGEHIFKQVTFMLKEIHSSLMKMAVYTEMSDLHEVKQHFILCIESVFENIDKLVRLTYTICPEFRFTLKYLLVDFMTTLRYIRSHCEHMMMTSDVEFSPKHMVMKIHEYTRECTEMLKELNHPMQMKVALRGYLRYVREILYHLEKQTMVGEKEFDLLMHHLTNKLREIVFPLMELTMTEEMFDMKIFRTKIISHLYDIVGIYEQLIQFCETKHIPVEIKYFIEKMMFCYCYAVKQVCYEMKFGYKIGFFMPQYYTTSFYGKYGYGLYEPMFRDHFMTYDMGMYSLFPMNKYFMGRYEKMYSPMMYTSKMNNYDMKYYSKYGMDLYTPKYGMSKYYKDMTYGHEHLNPKEMMMHIQMLVKRVVNDFEYRTMDTKNMKESTMYYIREFLTCVDLICNNMESVTYTDMMVKEFLMNLKETKMELEKMMSMRMFYNIHEIRMYMVRCMKMISTDLYKMTMLEKFDYEFFNKICVVYMNFLNKFTTKYTMYNREYSTMYDMPRTVYSGMKSHMEMMMHMQMLTKKIMECFKYDTMEMKHMSVYYMRNFMEIIDYCMEKMQVSMMDKSMCDKTIMREVFMHLKQMKMECEQFLTYRMDGMHMDKMMMHLMECIKMFTMQMERLVMFEDCRMEYPMLLKDICMRYVMFLERLCTKVGKFEMEYSPVMNYRNMMYHDSGMKTMMPFHYWRQMKY